MIENNVQNYGNANLMGALDEPLETEGAAIVGIDGKDMGWVVAPGALAGKLTDWHDLNRIDTKPFQVL